MTKGSSIPVLVRPFPLTAVMKSEMITCWGFYDEAIIAWLSWNLFQYHSRNFASGASHLFRALVIMVGFLQLTPLILALLPDLSCGSVFHLVSLESLLIIETGAVNCFLRVLFLMPLYIVRPTFYRSISSLLPTIGWFLTSTSILK
ncbi:hypothetical protein HAX54_032845 [Datura stramonium]|uniref:Uncharacterized protein n=1 Tax=Datura stramonium TaxID=4076 RepID=A0ABS8VDL1_DATST|nr:hypothetical protein [Datura stramonium]